MVDFDARSYGAGDPDFTRRNLKNKYALLTAKTISWLFNPFYLPTVAVTLLMIFSYLNQIDLRYRLAFGGIVVLFTWVFPLTAIYLYRSVNGWTSHQMSRRERRFVPYIVNIVCYSALYGLMELFGIPNFIATVIMSALLIQIVCAVTNVWIKVFDPRCGLGWRDRYAYGLLAHLWLRCHGLALLCHSAEWRGVHQSHGAEDAQLPRVTLRRGRGHDLRLGGGLVCVNRSPRNTTEASFFSRQFLHSPQYFSTMTPIVSIIMGSTSDLPVMEKAAQVFDQLEIPFEINALSAHRTPAEVESFARGAKDRGVRVIIAAAGMAAALPGVIAANTTLPVIGVPIKGMLDGLDALLSIVQMPPGIPCCHGWGERRDERRPAGCTNPCAPRRTTRRTFGTTQGESQTKDREGQRRVGHGEL